MHAQRVLVLMMAHVQQLVVAHHTRAHVRRDIREAIVKYVKHN